MVIAAMALLGGGGAVGAAVWRVLAASTAHRIADAAACDEVAFDRWQRERTARFVRWTSAHTNAETATDAAGRLAQPAPGHAAKIWDRADAPPMLVIPPGEYTMGSPISEAERFDDEGPQCRIAIRHPIAIGMYPVTRAEFASFVKDTGHISSAKCYGYAGETALKPKARFSWRTPGFPQTQQDPVVCVDWYDAKAYAGWLSAKTGRTYRLPSEAEWEYAARAGTTTARWWGDEADAGGDAGNFADLSAKIRFPDWTVANCYSGYLFTSPVDSFRPNGFGLHDMLGNVWQWVDDCATDGYGDDGPVDGSPRLSGDCSRRMLRGGSWHSHPRYVRSAARRSDKAGVGCAAYGFRVVAELPRNLRADASPVERRSRTSATILPITAAVSWRGRSFFLRRQ